jgi:hypothetical protein
MCKFKFNTKKDYPKKGNIRNISYINNNTRYWVIRNETSMEQIRELQLLGLNVSEMLTKQMLTKLVDDLYNNNIIEIETTINPHNFNQITTIKLPIR